MRSRPTAYEAFLRDRAESAADALTIPERAGAGRQIAELVSTRLDAVHAQLIELSHSIHANPELGFEEHHAAAEVARIVRSHGHDVEVGGYGLGTALRAVAGSGRPRVAILAEYDALPGIGHGCGHNVICAAGVGAFLAVAAVVDELGGSVELIGTPAEEGGSGKEYIARAGGFDEVDCAMMIHPAAGSAGASTYLGLRQVEVDYHGLGSHASAAPFMGRNALDGCVASYSMIAALRQHMLDTDRIHGVITNGGDKPNIVPELASAMYFVRSERLDTLLELTERLDAIFEAGALGTGTEVEVRWDVNPFVLPVRNNLTLASRFVGARRAVGDSFPLRHQVPSGSTDMGNVSVRVPSIHPKISIAPDTVSAHTAEFAHYAVSPSGDAGILAGAHGLAVTALDYLADPDLRDDVRREFEASGGMVDVSVLDR